MKIKNKRHLQSVIKSLMTVHGPNVNLNHLDVSAVTDMAELFKNSNFNGEIDQWDVSNVTTMYGMFHNATSFNQPIGKWDVSNVIDMTGMFLEARCFNQLIDKWSVSKVKSVRLMFDGATDFSNVESFLNWKVHESCLTEGCCSKKDFRSLRHEVERKALLNVLPPGEVDQRTTRKAL